MQVNYIINERACGETRTKESDVIRSAAAQPEWENPKRQRSVSDADEVVGQLLDRVGGRAGLHSAWVVGDEDGLSGFDDD